MKKARTRALAATAVAALCLSPLAACGGSESDSKSGDSKSDSSSSDSGSHDHLTKDDFADEIVEAMLEKKSAHMTMDMGQMKATGDFEYDGDDTVMHMDMGIGAQKIEMVIADQVMYMKAPGMAPAGKWVKFDKNSKGIGETIGKQLENMDPAGQIETMEKGLKKVTFVGEEKLDGEEYDKYEVTVDPTVALEGTKTPTQGVPKSLTYTMLLDEDHLLRHLEMTISGQKVSMDMTDWGKDVNVEVPKKADIVEFSMPQQ